MGRLGTRDWGSEPARAPHLRIHVNSRRSRGAANSAYASPSPSPSPDFMNAQRQTIPTAPSDLRALLAKQRAAHAARVPDYAQRMDDLGRLRRAFKAQLEQFAQAMSADFGRRSRHESLLSDGMTVLRDIDHIQAD